jgi:hypothetical protein
MNYVVDMGSGAIIYSFKIRKDIIIIDKQPFLSHSLPYKILPVLFELD